MGFPTVLIPGIFIKFFLNKREFSSNPYIYIRGKKICDDKKRTSTLEQREEKEAIIKDVPYRETGLNE